MRTRTGLRVPVGFAGQTAIGGFHVERDMPPVHVGKAAVFSTAFRS